MASLNIPATLERLEALAKAAGVGKMEIYRRLGVQPSTYSRWRKGELTPSLQNWAKVDQLMKQLEGG